MKYGISGLNRLNNNSNEPFNALLKSLNSQIFAARVVDIVLSPEHPKFEEVGGYNGIGTIFINPINPPLPNGSTFPIALPLFSNIKNFPLENEIVIVINLPSTNVQNNSDSKTLYYFNSINLWNHPHHNALPNPLNGDQLSDSQNKDYLETQIGSVRRVTDSSTEIPLGKTFKERSNIHPLYPFEGDIIYEGRWGNSIRLGSTANVRQNNWSRSGKEGEPILIIRNGQPSSVSDEGWIYTTEDITKDKSSIYFTSTQQIPLKVSSVNDYFSYKDKPIEVNKYKDPQIIINSGRLVFNSTEDHILLSSIKTINLNSIEGINIDTTKSVIFQTGKIFLGSKSAEEPLLLGNATVNLIKELIDSVKSLMLVTSELVSTEKGTPLAPLNTVSKQINNKLDSLSKQLDSLKSKSNFTV